MPSENYTQGPEEDEVTRMQREDEKTVFIEVEGGEEREEGPDGWPRVRAHSLMPDDIISQDGASQRTASQLIALNLEADSVETAIDKVNDVINANGTGSSSGPVLWSFSPPDESIDDVYDAYGAAFGEVSLSAVASEQSGVDEDMMVMD